MNKQYIRQSFDRASQSYDAAALIQRRVCDRLRSELLQALVRLTLTPRTILDAGCGTGYGAHLLRQQFPAAQLFGLDFAPAMIGKARAFFDHALVADMEAMPFAASCFDLWWSSLSIQWCAPHRVFAEAARSLRSGGVLAFSTLATQTFYELRSAFASIDPYAHTIAFNEAAVIEDALRHNGLRILSLHREQHSAFYPDLKTLLQSIRDIGAQQLGSQRRPGMLGRSAWQKIQQNYEQFRQPEGLPASYDVILGYAIKD